MLNFLENASRSEISGRVLLNLASVSWALVGGPARKRGKPESYKLDGDNTMVTKKKVTKQQPRNIRSERFRYALLLQNQID